MGGWRLNKEEFERCKKEAVEKTVEIKEMGITAGI